MNDKEYNTMINICNQIQADIERDVKESEGKPFDGKTVAMLFGYQGAAINALAGMIKRLAEDLRSNNSETISQEPSLRSIEIWMEGYAATGESGTAAKLGTYWAKDFDDAVRQYILDHPDIEKNAGPYRYEPKDFTSKEYYDNRRANWKIWGCALFDNEADARKAFG